MVMIVQKTVYILLYNEERKEYLDTEPPERDGNLYRFHFVFEQPLYNSVICTISQIIITLLAISILIS